MVGGLVKNEQVWLGNNGATECDSSLLPTGKPGDLAVGRRTIQMRHGGRDASIQMPAIVEHELVLDIVMPFGIGRQGFEFVNQIGDVLRASADVLLDR